MFAIATTNPIPVYGYQEDFPLTVLVRRRSASVLPTRTLFRAVGSPGGTGGSRSNSMPFAFTGQGLDMDIRTWYIGEQLLYNEAASSRTND